MIAATFATDIPGPPPAFLLGWRGNALRFSRDPLGYAGWLNRTYGDVATLVRGRKGLDISRVVPGCPGVVFVFGPEHNRQILTNPALFQDRFRTGLEDTALARLGAGIGNMNGTKHRDHRRLMLAAARKVAAGPYHGEVVGCTRRMLDGWSVGRRRDLWRDFWELTLRVVCRTVLGVEADAEAGGLVGTVWSWLRLSVSPASLALPVGLPLTPHGRFLGVSRRLDRVIASLIARRRALPRGNDFLGALLQAHEQDGGLVGADELVGEVNFLLIAGSASTTNALAWTLLLLVQHPAVLAEVCDELAGRLRGEPPTPEQLADLPLLDRVIRESLRLFPPIPLSGRIAVGPAELGGFVLPPLLAAVYSAYHTHRDPDRYPRPDRFDPDRWAGLDPSPYEYLPFGAGPRACLGEGLALVEIKIVLAMLLQRFRPELVPGSRIDRYVGIVLAPRRGLPMILRPPDRRFPPGPADLRGNVREMVEWG